MHAMDLTMPQMPLSAASCVVIATVTFLLIALLRVVTQEAVPSLRVELSEAEAQDSISATKYTPSKSSTTDQIPCYDPGNMQLLGHLPAMTSAQVKSVVADAQTAAKEWRHSSFKQRKLLLKAILKYTVEHQQEICSLQSVFKRLW